MKEAREVLLERLGDSFAISLIFPGSTSLATCLGTLAPHQLCCARQTPGIELELFLGFRKFDRPPANIRWLSFVSPSLVIPKMLVQVVDRFMRLGPPDPVGWTDKHRLINSLRMYRLEASVVLRAANLLKGEINPRSVTVRSTWSTRLRFYSCVRDPRRSLRSPDPADLGRGAQSSIFSVTFSTPACRKTDN